VLEVVYLIFNEGYSATAGDDWMRPALCEEALRLGRLLAGWPGRARGARPGGADGDPGLPDPRPHRPDGAPILLPDQDRRLWDRLLIRRGLAALAEAERLAAAAASSRAAPEARQRVLGPYALQAAIAACHARARRPRTPTGPHRRAVPVLGTVSPSPVVEAQPARSRWAGRGSGGRSGRARRGPVRAITERIRAVTGRRADLLASLGRVDEARAEFEARPG
jgi:predicted RNA polymerase sigma factor